MPIDVECPNPDCGCRMQFESPPPDGEVTCPACGEKIAVCPPEEAVSPEDEQAAIEAEYRAAADLSEKTALDIEPVRDLPPVAQPVEPAGGAEEEGESVDERS